MITKRQWGAYVKAVKTAFDNKRPDQEVYVKDKRVTLVTNNEILCESAEVNESGCLTKRIVSGYDIY